MATLGNAWKLVEALSLSGSCNQSSTCRPMCSQQIGCKGSRRCMWSLGFDGDRERLHAQWVGYMPPLRRRPPEDLARWPSPVMARRGAMVGGILGWLVVGPSIVAWEWPGRVRFHPHHPIIALLYFVNITFILVCIYMGCIVHICKFLWWNTFSWNFKNT